MTGAIMPSKDLLPPPFDWIEIPAGKVTLGGNKSANGGYISKATVFDVDAFAIAKYPVTNAQFRKFVDGAKGYTQRKWWTEAGWEAREQGWDWDSVKYEWKPTWKAWTEPRFWKDKKWNGDEYPVVGISWYEAIAFCRWLSEASGENILLPTDQQWQRAAQALPDGRDSGYAYPWGPDWDSERCNNSVGKDTRENRTSSVTRYEGKDKGDSPCGVVDMVGNVWEWCLTAYETGSDDLDGTDVRVLRGESWYGHVTAFFCADVRVDYDPLEGHDVTGFRCARS
jgi:formylglycine-generating enzyme required for sulfatase activity